MVTKLVSKFIIFTTCSLLASPAFADSPNKKERFIKKAGLTLTTFNVRNYSGSSKDLESIATNKSVLTSLLKNTKADLIAVQEIVDGEDFKSFIGKRFPKYGVRISNCGGTARQKLGFVYKKQKLTLTRFFEDSRLNEDGSCESGLRPAAVGHFKNKASNYSFVALAIHLKAGGSQRNADTRYKQYQVLKKIVREQRNKGNYNIVMMGDFNTTDYVLRNHNYTRYINFLDRSGLIDFSDSIACSSYWWGGIDDEVQYSSLLDHILVSESLWDRYRSQEVEVQSHCKRFSCRNTREDRLGPSFESVSDHCPVVASLRNN